ncbi:hypothetical protein BU14_0050s0019 [Porphyra umbilicalis]|uniref:Charged multivesicular body protein 2A n=1 Tax=Porphyra umbilicalis TaxID=2786 RepID=A0A1X6PII1_PORUM|nr:hypothetical protein BU14_0050s0019 [Porphyra umbilicalis]|eukprot:OSX80546.1 hypothetical protein BU14_0050s0019 [Porphyra umbilicalis]
MGLFKKRHVEPPPPPPPPPPTAAEQIRANKRQLQRAGREMERERMKLERTEVTTKNKIKAAARAGQMEAARMLAKDLVRTRNNVTRLYKMQTEMQSLSAQMTEMQTAGTMANAMGDAVKIMVTVSKTMNMPTMRATLMEYQREAAKMGMTQEMMQDTLDDTLGSADEVDQTEELVDSVMDELGLETSSRLGAVPSNKVGASSQMADEVDPSLNARLEHLRR